MSGEYEATIEQRSPVHWRASLNGLPLGEHRSEDEARAAIAAAMRRWYGLGLAPGETYGKATA
jgi:hypothetical protein